MSIQSARTWQSRNPSHSPFKSVVPMTGVEALARADRFDEVP
jgi:hypothetical protein